MQYNAKQTKNSMMPINKERNIHVGEVVKDENAMPTAIINRKKSDEAKRTERAIFEKQQRLAMTVSHKDKVDAKWASAVKVAIVGVLAVSTLGGLYLLGTSEAKAELPNAGQYSVDKIQYVDYGRNTQYEYFTEDLDHTEGSTNSYAQTDKTLDMYSKAAQSLAHEEDHEEAQAMMLAQVFPTKKGVQVPLEDIVQIEGGGAIYDLSRLTQKGAILLARRAIKKRYRHDSKIPHSAPVFVDITRIRPRCFRGVASGGGKFINTPKVVYIWRSGDLYQLPRQSYKPCLRLRLK